MSIEPYSVTRAERAEMVAALRADGLTYREIAERLNISLSYVRDLIYDPTGEKLAARIRSYQSACADCGGPTYGGEGRAKAPKRCDSCQRKRREAKHGTRSRYMRGCGCDACRAANTEYMRRLKGQPPPRHGASGYQNYGCRCQVCRDAHLVYMRSTDYEHQRAWAARVKQEPTPDHVHGTTNGYSTYGCRCDACRAANTKATRKWRQRRKAAA